ncbi:MAG: DUF2652 domain-containing protein [Betaproteobacteria bacterium]|nr:DUF2652 domain-containing protein [Betaproteobacteria bacterium]
MELKNVALVIIDISGYTRFIKYHKTSLIHAHEIISQLLESVIDNALHPLTLNKLEGDAALLYAELGNDEPRAVRDIFGQARGFFDAFHAKARELSGSRSNCPCEACQRIRDLRLKAILHRGQIAFRKIRQFDEMAGEDVILVHRLLKNTIAANQYMLLTEPFHRLLGEMTGGTAEIHEQTYDGMGSVKSVVFFPTFSA